MRNITVTKSFSDFVKSLENPPTHFSSGDYLITPYLRLDWKTQEVIIAFGVARLKSQHGGEISVVNYDHIHVTFSGEQDDLSDSFEMKEGISFDDDWKKEIERIKPHTVTFSVSDITW